MALKMKMSKRKFVKTQYLISAVRLVFNEPKRAHVTALFVSLHWLPVAARIKFKTLMLAYKTTTPAYFHSLLRIYIPSRSLRSASERRLVVPSQRGSNHSPEHSRSPFLPVEWSSHPYPECWIPVKLQATTENSCLSTLLNFILKNNTHTLCLSLCLSLSLLACFYLNNVWNLVLRALGLFASLRRIALCIPQL